MAFIRLVAALIGFVFGFFLGASLLQVTQVTPPTNQIYVVLLLATACAILGWLGAPYVTVCPRDTSSTRFARHRRATSSAVRSAPRSGSCSRSFSPFHSRSFLVR